MRARINKIYFLTLICLFQWIQNVNAGCNFGVTNSVVVGATHSYTIGQGPWGIRKYTWKWGDNHVDSSYTNSANNTWAAHTYSNDGVYTMTITACDSASNAGCTSYGYFSVTVTGAINTGIINNLLISNRIELYPNPFNDKLIIKNKIGSFFEIKDCFGKQLKIESYEKDESVLIETGSWPSGIYFLYVYDEKKGVVILKLVKHD